MGTQFSTVAMAWQIYELTNSPLHIGMLGLSRAIPQMALLLFGGLLADAVDRKRLLIVTQVGQFLVSAALVAITLSGRSSPLALYGANVFFAIFSSLESPARQTLPPNLVPRRELANVVALTNVQRHVGMIAGPSMAGIALGFVGPALCYGVDAISWLAMAFSLVCIRTPAQRHRPSSHILELTQGRRQFCAIPTGDFAAYVPRLRHDVFWIDPRTTSHLCA